MTTPLTNLNDPGLKTISTKPFIDLKTGKTSSESVQKPAISLPDSFQPQQSIGLSMFATDPKNARSSNKSEQSPTYMFETKPESQEPGQPVVMAKAQAKPNFPTIKTTTFTNAQNVARKYLDEHGFKNKAMTHDALEQSGFFKDLPNLSNGGNAIKLKENNDAIQVFGDKGWNLKDENNFQALAQKSSNDAKDVLTLADAKAAKLLKEPPVSQTLNGIASWYGPGLEGNSTSNGEKLNKFAMTAAHPTLPFGTQVKVTYEGKSVIVRINDRGPFGTGAAIDLTQGAAEVLGLKNAGRGPVKMEVLASK